MEYEARLDNKIRIIGHPFRKWYWDTEVDSKVAEWIYGEEDAESAYEKGDAYRNCLAIQRIAENNPEYQTLWDEFLHQCSKCDRLTYRGRPTRPAEYTDGTPAYFFAPDIWFKATKECFHQIPNEVFKHIMGFAFFYPHKTEENKIQYFQFEMWADKYSRAKMELIHGLKGFVEVEYEYDCDNYAVVRGVQEQLIQYILEYTNDQIVDKFTDNLGRNKRRFKQKRQLLRLKYCCQNVVFKKDDMNSFMAVVKCLMFVSRTIKEVGFFIEWFSGSNVSASDSYGVFKDIVEIRRFITQPIKLLKKGYIKIHITHPPIIVKKRK